MTAPEPREAYTTGQAAALCQISTTTVQKLCDAGTLACFRVPGPRRTRRITRKALADFARAHGLDHALEALGEVEPAAAPEPAA